MDGGGGSPPTHIPKVNSANEVCDLLNVSGQEISAQEKRLSVDAGLSLLHLHKVAVADVV
jgi:hypothetical protein